MPKPVRPSRTASTAIATLRAGELVVLGSMDSGVNGTALEPESGPTVTRVVTSLDGGVRRGRQGSYSNQTARPFIERIQLPWHNAPVSETCCAR